MTTEAASHAIPAVVQDPEQKLAEVVPQQVAVGDMQGKGDVSSDIAMGVEGKQDSDVVDLTVAAVDPSAPGADDVVQEEAGLAEPNADLERVPFDWPEGPLSVARDEQLRTHPPRLGGLTLGWPAAPADGRHAAAWQQLPFPDLAAAVGREQAAFNWSTEPQSEDASADWRSTLCAARSANARKTVDAAVRRSVEFTHATSQPGAGGQLLYTDTVADVHLCVDVYDSSQDRGLGTDLGLLLFPGREVRRSVSLCRDDAPLLLWYFMFALRLPSVRDGRMHIVLASAPVEDVATQCVVFSMVPLFTAARGPGGATPATVRTVSQVSMTDQKSPRVLVNYRALLAAAVEELPSLIEMEYGLLGTSRLATAGSGSDRDTDALHALRGADAADNWATSSLPYGESVLWRPVELVPTESALLRGAWFRSRQANAIIKDLVARVAAADDLRDKLAASQAKTKTVQNKLDALQIKHSHDTAMADRKAKAGTFKKLTKDHEKKLEAHLHCPTKRDLEFLVALKASHANGACKHANTAKRKADAEVESLQQKVRKLERELEDSASKVSVPVARVDVPYERRGGDERGGASLDQVRLFMNPLVGLVEGAMSHLGRASNPSRTGAPAKRTAEEIIASVDEDMTVRLLAGCEDATRSAFYATVKQRLSVGAMLAVKTAVDAVAAAGASAR